MSTSRLRASPSNGEVHVHDVDPSRAGSTTWTAAAANGSPPNAADRDATLGVDDA